MLAQLASMLLTLHTPSPAPAPGDARELRIVAVEQAGGPPYSPRDGRVYRLGGDAIADVRLGEILIVRRPGEVRDIGCLRVVSVHTENFAANSALARLESRGETFPLKGDVASKLAPTEMPKISGAAAQALKNGPPPPLNPPLMPALPSGEIRAAAQTGPQSGLQSGPATGPRTGTQPRTQTGPQTGQQTRPQAGQRAAQTGPRVAQAGPQTRTQTRTQAGPATAAQTVQAGTQAGPQQTAQAGGILSMAPILPPSLQSGQNAQSAQNTPSGQAAPRFLERNPIYFPKGSAEISPMGLTKIKEWADAWNARGGLACFLSVPQNQLHAQKLTADRMAAIADELRRLGVAAVELRYDEKAAAGPHDVVYVGAEGPAR